MTITSTQLYNEVLEAMDNFQVILVRSSFSLEIASVYYYIDGSNSSNTWLEVGGNITLSPETFATNLYEPTNFTPIVEAGTIA